MNYYIERPNTWKAANRKCAEIQEFVDQFRNCLIYGKTSRDALIKEIRDKVEKLNNVYPRTKRLVLDCGSDRISCYPEGRACDYEYVFTIDIHPVKRTYGFVEVRSDES